MTSHTATHDEVSEAARKAGAERPIYRMLADAIADDVASGAIPIGVAVSETMLAQIFKVSRTPARQALETLAEDGVICPTKARGFVTGTSPHPVNGRLTDYANQIGALTDGHGGEAAAPEVFNDLERQITHLSVLGTWRISIRAVQEIYDIPRSALEDILRDFATNGLLARRPGGQWIIPRMDCERLEALFDVRSWLEPQLLERATFNIPMEVLQEVIAAHEAALNRLPHVTSRELDALEGMLHLRLTAYSGNAPGVAALRTVTAGIVMSKHILATEEIPIGSEDPFIEEHIAVLDALKRRRAEECKVRLLAHLLKSREKCATRLQRYRDIAKETSSDFAKRIDR